MKEKRVVSFPYRFCIDSDGVPSRIDFQGGWHGVNYRGNSGLGSSHAFFLPEDIPHITGGKVTIEREDNGHWFVSSDDMPHVYAAIHAALIRLGLPIVEVPEPPSENDNP